MKAREILELAKISSKYYRFLNPDIVAAIAEDNEKNRLTEDAFA